MDRKTELQLNEIASERRKQKQVYQRTLDMQWLNNRMEDGRMGRCLALVHREAEMEKDYQERTDHAAIVNATVAKEVSLGYEVAKAQREEVVAYQRRHYLRERDPSLKELTRKLQAAYVCRDLQQQIRNNEYRRLQEKAEEKEAIEKLNDAIYSAQEYQAVEDQAKAERNAKYCQELQQQLVFRQTQKQCQYEDTLIEKKMLDEIMRTIADEDKRELQQKREITEKIRQEMETVKKAQDAWRDKQRAIVLLEEKEIERQQQAKSDRDASIIAERLRRQQQKDETIDKIASKVLANEYARQERDRVIKLLQEQEALEAQIQDDIATKAKIERVKQETKAALNEQMQTRRQQEQKERESSAQYLQQIKKKMAEEEAKEKEKHLQVREKNRHHCALLLKQAEEQRRIKWEQQHGDALRAEAMREYERNWCDEVKKEREAIIKEHVPGLLGYLQAGVIKKEDLPLVREGANQNPELAKLKIEDLVQSKRPKRFAKCNAQCKILREY